MEDIANGQYTSLKKPDNRILQSGGRYFIANAPSASIIPIGKKLAQLFIDNEETHRNQKIKQLEQLTNLGIAQLSEEPHNEYVVNCVNPPIKTLIFHVTQKCNLRCIHCYIEANETNIGELNGETICDTITDFADLGGLVVDITGGEPLLREDIFDILAVSKNKGLHTNLLSNGVNISKGLARRIKENVSRITISIDGLNRTHDWIRGDGVFNKVKSSIDYLVEEGVPIGATTVFTYRNLGQLEDIQSFLISKNISFWSLVLPRKVGRFKDDEISNLTCEEWFSNIKKYYALLKRMKQRAKESNMEVVIDHVMIPYEDRKEMRIDPESLSYFLYTKGRVCWDNTITIMPNGDVKGCLFIDGFVYGNLKDDSLKAIYCSDRRRGAIEKFEEMKGERECPIIHICDSN